MEFVVFCIGNIHWPVVLLRWSYIIKKFVPQNRSEFEDSGLSLSLSFSLCMITISIRRWLSPGDCCYFSTLLVRQKQRRQVIVCCYNNNINNNNIHVHTKGMPSFVETLRVPPMICAYYLHVRGTIASRTKPTQHTCLFISGRRVCRRFRSVAFAS